MINSSEEGYVHAFYRMTSNITELFSEIQSDINIEILLIPDPKML